MTPVRIPLAIVHHANQYLITNGYLNRPGIEETVGPKDGSSGLRAVLELHSKYEIPFHLHISGTLIEACAWYEPLFLEEISDLWHAGLVELIGSTYSQNIMPLFSQTFNRYQIEEELRLYQAWIGVQPAEVKGFWIPERVWNTGRLAKTIADSTLSNRGFSYVLADDRLFLQDTERSAYDQQLSYQADLFKPSRIKGAQGLIALPLSTEMRWGLPFRTEYNEAKLDALMANLWKTMSSGQDVIAIYGDDMEKAAGIPPMWDPQSLEHYERFMKWLKRRQDVEPILIGSWLRGRTRKWPIKPLGPGTYMELAGQFGAGEDYSGWAGSDLWRPYQKMFDRAWEKVNRFTVTEGGASALHDLSIKHLLACSYETGWHDPGVSWKDASPAPWARALASHARAAYILLEAAKWQQETDNTERLELTVADLDEDGHEEVILRNHRFAVVISPRFGGRILYAFSFNEKDGCMIIGNPSDDWNLLEELNSFMEKPMNHPGALADNGFEHDIYEIEAALNEEGTSAEVVIVNRELGSRAYGLRKRFVLNKGQQRLLVKYEHIPPSILPLSLDIGLSPDYLRLLREGRALLVPYKEGEKQGYRCGNLFVWVRIESEGVKWHIARSPIFGHGVCKALTLTSGEAAFHIGVDDLNEA